jgi:hypothetical protein
MLPHQKQFGLEFHRFEILMERMQMDFVQSGGVLKASNKYMQKAAYSYRCFYKADIK